MPTANDMISRALRLIGVKGQGTRTLTANEAADGLNALNTMLDSWSIDRAKIYQLLTETHTLVVGTADYSIGTGGDISTTRPTRIEQAFIRDSAGYDYPVTIINKKAYDMVTLKTTQSRPKYLYYDEIFPLAFIRLVYTPSDTDVLHFTSWKQMQQFSTGTTALAMPPGYQRAIEFNLALELQPEYNPDLDVSPATREIARESLSKITGINQDTPVMDVTDPIITIEGRSHRNIFTG
jgi:hypothetical protein